MLHIDSGSPTLDPSASIYTPIHNEYRHYFCVAVCPRSRYTRSAPSLIAPYLSQMEFGPHDRAAACTFFAIITGAGGGIERKGRGHMDSVYGVRCDSLSLTRCTFARHMRTNRMTVRWPRSPISSEWLEKVIRARKITHASSHDKRQHQPAHEHEPSWVIQLLCVYNTCDNILQLCACVFVCFAADCTMCQHVWLYECARKVNPRTGLGAYAVWRSANINPSKSKITTDAVVMQYLIILIIWQNLKTNWFKNM